jgi:hypothetical protein
MQGPRCAHICFEGKKFPNGAASSPGMAHCGGGPALDHFAYHKRAFGQAIS